MAAQTKRDNGYPYLILFGAAGLGFLWYRSRQRSVKPPLPGSAHPGSGTGEPAHGRAPGQVPRVLTAMPPSTAVELIRLLTASELGREYTNEAGLMLAAHSALETGNWQSMYNYNFGNVTTGGSRPWFLNPESDTIHKYIDERNPEEGAMAFVRLILRKYQPCVYAAKVGDPALYARKLKEGGYYEAPVEQYTATLTKLYSTFVTKYGWKPV